MRSDVIFKKTRDTSESNCPSVSLDAKCALNSLTRCALQFWQSRQTSKDDRSRPPR